MPWLHLCDMCISSALTLEEQIHLLICCLFRALQSWLQMLVESNNLSDNIIVLPGKIEEISLPEAVDVIISELMGCVLFNERMLESYLHSKKVAENNWYQRCCFGVSLSSLQGAAVEEYFSQPVVTAL
ncbi:histone-arginine methyltransferase CARM1-like [Dama dama]|uniref:histone-arginine methyltransferase CARM1-like n=1 Tax=Dama dama TaxID=30532 RepID=UPI002A361516|nr:histone-arginine methyltransferase CARM1-like [Dama dama]